MSNMSYCRFQNTLDDMRDCLDALSEMDDLSELSVDERNAAIRMVEVAQGLADDLTAMKGDDDA
jgi:hypothetical protein